MKPKSIITSFALAAVVACAPNNHAATNATEEVAGVTLDDAVAQAKVVETPAQRDARMAWWREAKFGLFIHWGVYAVPAGKFGNNTNYGEWIMNSAKIPVATYREFASQFNPVKYNPELWAKTAKDAGMKYIVITSKHHDGFALYPSEASKWNIADATPYKKDLLGPLVSAAKAEGLKIGFYYSQSPAALRAASRKAKAGMTHTKATTTRISRTSPFRRRGKSLRAIRSTSCGGTRRCT